MALDYIALDLRDVQPWRHAMRPGDPVADAGAIQWSQKGTCSRTGADEADGDKRPDGRRSVGPRTCGGDRRAAPAASRRERRQVQVPGAKFMQAVAAGPAGHQARWSAAATSWSEVVDDDADLRRSPRRRLAAVGAAALEVLEAGWQIRVPLKKGSIASVFYRAFDPVSMSCTRRPSADLARAGLPVP
jgi:hypothetical protein